MLRKSQLILLLLVGLVSSIKAQDDKVQWPEFKGKFPFQDYVNHQLVIDTRVGYANCSHFLASVEFNVDKKGYVENVLVSKEIPVYVREKLRNIVESTHGTWTSMKINNKVSSSYPMILIVYFRLDSGCISEDKFVGEEKIDTSLENLFKFDRGTKSDKPVKIIGATSVYFPTGTTDLGDYLKQKNKN